MSMNEVRADWAETAVMAFREEVFMDPLTEDNKTGFGDLLCDLRHLADRYGLDWDGMLARADSNYTAEVGEEPKCRKVRRQYPARPGAAKVA